AVLDRAAGGIGVAMNEETYRLIDGFRPLTKNIAQFSDRAHKGSNRLVVATWALAIFAILAAAIGAYATLSVEPQIVVVPSPTPPAGLVTPAPPVAVPTPTTPRKP